MGKNIKGSHKGRQVYVMGSEKASTPSKYLLFFFVVILVLGAALLIFPETEELSSPENNSKDESESVFREELYAGASVEAANVGTAELIQIDNRDAARLNSEGVDLMESGNYSEAAVKFSEALALLSSSQTIKNNLANAYMGAGWKFFEGKDYETAQTYFSNSIEMTATASAFKGRGMALLGAGRRSAAASDIEQSILLDKNDLHAHMLLGRLLYESNDLEGAGRYFETALLISPGNAGAIAFLKKIKREVVEDSFRGKESSNFYVKYEGLENAETGHLLLMVLEEAYHKVGADIGLYPEKPVTVILYSDKQFSDVTRSPAWAGGLYDGKIRLPSGGISKKTDELMRVVYHEYTHALVHQETRGNCPTWLNEGLAQFAEGAEVLRAKDIVRSMGGPVPLAQLENSFMQLDASQASRAYATSLLAVNYIIDDYSFSYIKSILSLLGEGKGIAGALQSVLYLSYVEFEKSFINSM